MHPIPLFLTPFTDLCWIMAPNIKRPSQSPMCQVLEDKFTHCIDTFGFTKGKEKCGTLFYDMHECYFANLQRLRANKIRRERMKQYREGKLEKPFDEYPPLDSYMYM